ASLDSGRWTAHSTGLGILGERVALNLPLFPQYEIHPSQKTEGGFILIHEGKMTAKVKLFFAVLALLLFISSGCRRTTSVPSGPSISGKVTLNGKPVTGGTMFLVPKSGPPEIRVEIKPDGTFKKSGVRTGEMQVAIETESIKGAAGGGIGEKEQEKGKIEKLP